MKRVLVAMIGVSAAGCATLTEDPMTPIALSFSDGSSGECDLENKRGLWNTSVPTTVSVRKSDDVLKYRCKTQDGRTASGSMPSEMGGKIIASAVFIDFGITDAITDKHRRYPASYVVPIVKVDQQPAAATAASVNPISPAPAPVATPDASPQSAPPAQP